MSFSDTRARMLNSEAQLVATFYEDAGATLTLADDAAALLLTVLLTAAPETTELELLVGDDNKLSGDVAGLQLAAQVFIGIRTFRAMRGGQRCLAAGYELEARALDRILIELQAHRSAIFQDETGAEALAWLQGERGRGISKKVNKTAPKDLYKNLSHDSHGDPIGVTRLMDTDGQSVFLSPKRTPSTRASLLLHAGEARDQAIAIAQLAKIEVSGLDELDAAIKAQWQALLAESEPA
jgi:hypothetical protein